MSSVWKNRRYPSFTPLLAYVNSFAKYPIAADELLAQIARIVPFGQEVALRVHNMRLGDSCLQAVRRPPQKTSGFKQG